MHKIKLVRHCLTCLLYTSRVGDYLYAGPDMIEQNMGMEMIIRGHQEFYPMISAGVNWYMARAECEFVLDDTSAVSYTHLDVYKRQVSTLLG